MQITLKLICVIVALVFFALQFFNVPKYNWMNGGFFFLTLAAFIV